MEPTNASTTARLEIRRKNWTHPTLGEVTRLQILAYVPEGEGWKTTVLSFGDSILPEELEATEAKAIKRAARRFGIQLESAPRRTSSGNLSSTAPVTRSNKWGIDPNLSKDEKRKARKAARKAAKGQD